MAAISGRELIRQVQLEGAPKVAQLLVEALDKKELAPRDFSIRDLAYAFIPDGQSWVEHLGSRKGGFRSLTEATNAVDTSMFASITGQVFYNKLTDGYNLPELLWSKLVDTHSSTILNGERIAGVGEIGDAAEAITEGSPYPIVGVNEEFVDTPASVKRGFEVDVTKEIIVADKTGLVLDRCGAGSKWLALNKEKRVLDYATGQVNTYKRNTVSTNTYLTSGAYVNSFSNTLVDHTDFENAEVTLAAITDPNTGEYYSVDNVDILVPLALYKTAVRIAKATEVAVVDNSATTATARQWSPAPGPMWKGWNVLTNQYVYARTSSNTTWFAGDFKAAFGYISIWDITTQQLGAGTEADFSRDVVTRFKVSEMGTPYVKNPRRVVKCT